LFPVFYLSLLLPDLFPEHIQAGRHRARRQGDWANRGRGPASSRNLRPIIVAVLAAGITLALTPVAPPGVPVLVAATAALIGLRPPPQTVTHAGAGDDT
jgi:hypothetical protein